MTEYNLDGVVITEENKFTNTSMEIEQIRSYFLGELSVFRNQNPCNYTFPVTIQLPEDAISFSPNSIPCGAPNKIDPYFYDIPPYTFDSVIYTKSGEWELEHLDKRIFIITNKNQVRKNTIRIVFEKTK